MRSNPSALRRTRVRRGMAGLLAGIVALVPVLLLAGPANAAAGDFTEYTANGAQVRYVGLGPGGNPWFTSNDGSSIGFVDVSTGATTNYSVSGYSAFTGITEGPDGNMWFLAVGNVDPNNGTFLVKFDVSTHTFTHFPVPSAGNVSNVVAADGDLWVTEGVGQALAQFNPTTGSWQEWPVPGADPVGLALAPDGLLWFTMYNAHTVASIDPSAADPDSTIQVATSQPANLGSTSLAVAPNGVVWVAENNDNRLDSYDPSTSTWTTGQDLGAAVDFDLFDVTIGPDNNPWYSLYGYDGVGTVDATTGDPTNYRIDAGTYGTQWNSGIVSASDGNIWSGAYFGENMWRFELSHPAKITTTTLPNGKVKHAYSAAVAATGTGPITFAVTTGTLPDGLTLDAATGVISGTPTKAGSSTFTVTATGADGSGTQSFTIVVGVVLATTGVDVEAPMLAGLLLLVLGAGVMLLRRRPRSVA